MKANTISRRRPGWSSPSKACLSATLTDRFEATASARIEGSSISVSCIDGFGRQALVELGVIFELLDHRAHQRRGLGGVALDLVDQLDLGRLVAGAVDQVDQPRALDALDQHADGAVGQLQQLHRGGDHAEVVERVAVGIVLARVELGDEEQLLVARHRRLERGDRFLAADEQGHDAVREHDDVAERKDGKCAGGHGHHMGERAAQRNGRGVGATQPNAIFSAGSRFWSAWVARRRRCAAHTLRSRHTR